MKRVRKYARKSVLVSVSILIALLSAGCNQPEKVGQITSGDTQFERICIDGVEYLQQLRGNRGLLAAHFKPDGTVYACGR